MMWAPILPPERWLNLPRLPILDALPALRSALELRNNVVLQAPPGAGKSTCVPLALLDAPWLKSRKVLMLEPRRIAARAVATRMAHILGERVGQTIGYRTRLDTKVSAATRVEVVTEGILTRMLQSDPALEDTGLVIFDEFHERSLQADLGLALSLDAQQVVRDDLRLLVMSATLDGAAVAAVLGDAPIVSSSGQTYAVETRYRVRGENAHRNRDIAREVAGVIQRALTEEHGDMLVFLPGQSEIHRIARLLSESAADGSLKILPLYGNLTAAEQDAALRPAAAGERKVVLATNIAESSLTIEGTRVVIDSGLERRNSFDPALGMSRLQTVRISRASADQRRGRAGRLSSGVCYRLWTQGEDASLAAQSPAEITHADLAPLALELAAWGISDPSRLRWLDLPPSASFSQARDLLQSLDALGNDGKITPHGNEMIGLGVHPRLAHMLLKARALGLAGLAAEIAALLMERDLLKTSAQRDIDLSVRVDALHASKVASAEIDRSTRQRVQHSAQVLTQRLGASPSAQSHAQPDEVGRLLAFAYPDRIAMARGEQGRYVLASSRAARLPAAQAWGDQRFIVIAELDAGEKEAKIALAAPYSLELLQRDFAEHLDTSERHEWDARTGAVVASSERKFGALILEERRIEQPSADKLEAAMISGLRQLGIAALPWTAEARNLQARLHFVKGLDVQGAWPAVDDAELSEDLQSWFAPWIAGITRREQLNRLDLQEVLLAPLSWEQRRQLDALAPTHLSVPSGSRIPIDYLSSVPSVAVRLQEMFGMTQTPTIGNGRVAITIHLLSPAHRPVQVTRDLASFWTQGYAEVRKELKGRYPRHYWPDDPLTAIATARAKPRR